MVKIVSKLWQWDINNDIVTYVHEKFKLVKSHTHTYTNENKDLKIYLSRVLSYEQTISLKLICRDNVYEDTKRLYNSTQLMIQSWKLIGMYIHGEKILCQWKIYLCRASIFWHKFMCYHKVLFTAPVAV